MNTLETLLSFVDPQEGLPPLTSADQCESDGLVCEEYVSPTNTAYLIGHDPETGEVVRDDRPWQLRMT